MDKATVMVNKNSCGIFFFEFIPLFVKVACGVRRKQTATAATLFHSTWTAFADAIENGVSATSFGIFDCASNSFVAQNLYSRRME